MKLLKDLFQNKYGKYSLSKIIPAVWFVFLLVVLSTVFKGKDIPEGYYQLTMIFSTVYVGRAAVDKIKETSITSMTSSTSTIQTTPTVVQSTPIILSNDPPPEPTN